MIENSILTAIQRAEEVGDDYQLFLARFLLRNFTHLTEQGLKDVQIEDLSERVPEELRLLLTSNAGTVRVLRSSIAMNQAELGVALNYDQSLISKFETGKRKPTKQFMRDLGRLVQQKRADSIMANLSEE